MTTRITEGLNPRQLEAVTAPLQNMLILAGAGSGKTRVLVHRIAWLIETGQVAPFNILAVTFTNKAAQELKTRIEALLDGYMPGLWVGTFHSIAHRMLRRHAQAAGLSQDFQILDSDDQLRSIKRLIKDQGLDEKKYPARQIQWFINSQKDEGLRSSHVDRHLFDPNWVTLYQLYENKLTQSDTVDFAELLLKAHELVRDQDAIGDYYRQRFNTLLVDEFQDTNKIQYAWLRVLAGQTNQVIAVGDDDQSIYGWRGACVDHMQQFQHHFIPNTIIRLEQNYRSTPTILSAANQLISYNASRLGKELWSDKQDGEPIKLYCAYNEIDEARFIADTIEKSVKEGASYTDNAILYRSNAQSRALEEALILNNMPYRIFGGLKFYERAEIKNALAYLRLIVNKADSTAFERIINVPKRGIGQSTLDKLQGIALEQNLSLWQALESALKQQIFSSRASNALKSFHLLIEALTEKLDELDTTLFIEHVIEHSGLIEHHQKERGEVGQNKVENLNELINAISRFNPDEAISVLDEDTSPEDSQEFAPVTEDTTHSIISKFLSFTVLEAGERGNGNETGVQLMTLHSAKGLEFPQVFMVGMEDGLFPNQMTLDESLELGLEEERRLCYVGITRAMQQLYLSYAQTRRLHGYEDNRRIPSRFLRELPKETLNEIAIKQTITKPSPASYYGSASQRQQNGNGPAFQLGQRVLHQSFGEGTILDYEGSGAQTRVRVAFEAKGIKWLVLAYAKLEAI